MSFGIIEHFGKSIIYLNLEGIEDNREKAIQIVKLNEVAKNANERLLLLVNVKNFIPGPEFFDSAAYTLSDRADKLKKVAYIGISQKNRKLYEMYEKYTPKIVIRKVFKSKSEAINWLIEE
jgi:hypothetical protein